MILFAKELLNVCSGLKGSNCAEDEGCCIGEGADGNTKMMTSEEGF